jgi:hypothetical protein
MLRDACEKAAARGLQGMKVPGGRALVAANLPKGYELWPEAEFLERTGTEHEEALKRAGVLGRGHHVTFFSDDTVGRSPTAPPWRNLSTSMRHRVAGFTGRWPPCSGAS